jgi:integrase
MVALAVVHAARWEAIRDLTLDDIDLPNRRITIAGHPQRLGDLSHKALRTWLDHRRPHGRTPPTGTSWSRRRPRSATSRSAEATSTGTCSVTASASSAYAATACSTRR